MVRRIRHAEADEVPGSICLSRSMAEPPAVLSGARPWVVWGLSALFVVYNFLHQVVPGLIAPELTREFDLGAAELGGIAALFFYSYAVFQIPAGLVLDRYGPHRPLVGAAAVAALGSLLLSAADSAGSAGLGRLVIGAGAAFSFIASLKLVSNWFAPGRFATLAGLTNTAAMIGAAGGTPLALVVAALGWRGSLGLLAGAGAGLAVLILLFVRDRPALAAGGRSDRIPEPDTAPGPLLQGLRLILGNPQVWVNALYATASSIVFVAFGALWGTSYIEIAYEVSRIEASSVVSILFLGAIPGSMFFGWVSDRGRSRKTPMLAAAAGGLAAMCALLYLPGIPLNVARALLGVLGFCCSANIVSYAVSHDICPPGRSGLSLGLLNTCFYAGNAASQPLVGWLLDRRGALRASAGFPGIAGLEAADFSFALFIVVAALLLALVAAVLLRESHPRAGS